MVKIYVELKYFLRKLDISESVVLQNNPLGFKITYSLYINEITYKIFTNSRVKQVENIVIKRKAKKFGMCFNIR